MKLKFLLVTLLSVLPVGNAVANCNSKQCTGYIERLYTKENGMVFVNTSGDETMLNCTPVSDIYVSMDLNSEGASAIYSKLLAAFMADREVTIRIVDKDNRCDINYVLIDRE